MEEELYEEYIRELLYHDGDGKYSDLCTEPRARLNRKQRKHYYYRCLTVIMAQAFISWLGNCRNYVTTADVIDHFPHFNFSTLFRRICEVLHGTYERGKCYTYLTHDDYVQFLRIKNRTKTPDELLREWDKYVAQVAATRKAHFAAYMAECRRQQQAEAVEAAVHNPVDRVG